jgi:hypothetical protein
MLAEAKFEDELGSQIKNRAMLAFGVVIAFAITAQQSAFLRVSVVCWLALFRSFFC